MNKKRNVLLFTMLIIIIAILFVGIIYQFITIISLKEQIKSLTI